MIRAMRERLRSDDSGLTLVEIVIYMVLAVVVGTIVVSVLIGTLKGQDQVTSTTTATTRGQVVAQSIEKALRNATAVSVPDGMTLKAVTTLGKPCQAWRLVRNSDDSNAAGKDVYDLQLSQGTSFASWAVIARGLVLDAGQPVFAYIGSAYSYSLHFATDLNPKVSADMPSVDFTGRVAPRGTGGDLATCS